MIRKSLNAALTASLTLCMLSADALAQNYPTRPIRLIVPFSPGGTTDLVARAIAPKLNELLGQQVVVDNRPGASTIIGTEVVAKAPADGHTVMVATPDFTVNPSLMPKLPYNAEKDFVPLSLIATYPMVLVTNPSLPVRSAKELVALAKAKPGQINYASAGSGSMPNLCAELFNSLAHVTITHIPYKGNGPAIVDLIAGQVQLLFTGMPPVAGHVKNGKLKAIGVTGKKRLSSAPEIPTIDESGVRGYDVIAWFGFLGTGGTPKPVVARLNTEIARAMQDAQVRERLASLGADLGASTQDEYRTLLRAEIAKWGKVVKEAGIKAE